MKTIRLRLFHFILLFGCIVTAHSQGYNWLTELEPQGVLVNYNGPKIRETVVDSMGNIYAVGSFYSGMQLGGQSYTGTLEEGFICKMDSNGTVVWVKTFGGTGNDLAYSVAIDAYGGLYVTGSIQQLATFDTISVTPATGGGWLGTIYLAKFDNNGNAVWVKSGGLNDQYSVTLYASHSYGQKVHVSDSSVYMVSSYEMGTNVLAASKSFDGETLNPGIGFWNERGVFAIKTSLTGDNDWVECLSGTTSGSIVEGLSSDVNDSGNLVIFALAGGPTTFSGSSISAFGPQYLIVEADSDGDYIQHKSVPTSNSWLYTYNFNHIGYLDNGGFILTVENVNSAITVDGLTIPGTNTSIIKANDSLTFTSVQPIVANGTSASKITAFKVDGEDVMLGIIANNQITLAGQNVFSGNELVFANVDTTLTTVNFTAASETTVASGWIWSNWYYRDAVYSCDKMGVGKYVFGGNIGVTNRNFGDFQVLSNTNSSTGFITQIVECYDITNEITSSDSVLCSAGASALFSTNISSSLTGNWFLNTAEVPGATGSSFIANNAGDYFFLGDSLGCKDTSNVVGVASSTSPTVTVPTTAFAVCNNAGLVRIPDGTPAGGYWTGTGVVNDTMFNPATVGTGPSLLTYNYFNPAGCSGNALRIANVVTPPTLYLSGTPPSYCSGDPSASLLGVVLPSGGSYSGPGVTNDVFYPDSAGIGTHIITYRYSVGAGCNDSLTFNIVVNPSPVVNFPAINPVCYTTNTVPLTMATPSGGQYSGNYVIGNSFYPFFSGVGTYPVTYSVTQNGCTTASTKSIQVDPLPMASISGLTDVCVDAPSFTLNGGSPAGGTFYINTVMDSVVNPSNLGVGQHTVWYVYSNSCGVDTAIQTFNVNALPNVVMASVGPLCDNQGSVTLNQGSPTGGSYSMGGAIINTINANSIGLGTHNVVYTYTNSNGCVAKDSTLVAVNASPTATTTLDSIFCVDAGSQLLNAFPTGGVWTGNNIGSGSFDVSAAGVGNHQLTYTVSNSNNCSDTLIHSIEVKSLPSVSLASFTPICNNTNAPVPLQGGIPMGGVYSGNGVSNNIFDASIAGSGFHPIAYTYTDSFGCSSSATQTLTVNATTANVSLQPFSNYCVDAVPFALNGGAPSGGTYAGVGVVNGMFDASLAGVGSHQIVYSYLGTNSCIASVAQTIVVDSLPVVSIDPVVNQCANNGPVMLNAQPLSGTFSGTGVANGQFDPAAANPGVHNVVYDFTDANQCSASDTISIEVYGVPAVTNSIPNSLCAYDTALPLTAGMPIGGVYSGTGVSGGFFDPTLVGSGTYGVVYTYTDTNFCTVSDTDSIAVYSPMVTLPAFSDECSNNNAFVLNSATPVGGTYAGMGVSGNQFDPSIAGAGTHQITYTDTINGCVASDTQLITVHAAPVAFLSNLGNICESDTSFLLQQGAPFGGVYSGTGVSGVNFNASVAGAGVHSITYTVTDTNNCSAIATDSITVFALPNVSMTSLPDICANDSDFVLNNASPSGGYYYGTGVNNGIFSNQFTLGASQAQIFYTYTDSLGCQNWVSDTFEIFTAPTVNLAALADVCSDSSVVTLAGGMPIGGVYSGVNVSNGNFNVSVAGVGSHNVMYTYTDSNNCTSVDTQSIVVNALPVLTMPTWNSICENGSLLALSGAQPLGGTYSGVGVANGVFDPLAATAGSHMIMYSYTDSNQCTNVDSASIMVDTIPIVMVTSIGVACESDSAFVLSGGIPSAGTFFGSFVTNNEFDAVNAGVGPHPISYAYADANGCADTVSTNVTVNGLPVVSLTNDTICYSNSMHALTGGLPVGGMFSGSFVTSGDFDVAQSGSGLFQFNYSYTDSFGCSNETMATLLVNALPMVNAGTDTAICDGENITLMASGANTYVWSTGATTDTIVVSPTQTKNYVVSGVDTNSCSNTDTIEVVVNGIPNVAINSPDSLCWGDVAVLDAGTGFNRYVWNTQDSTQVINFGPLKGDTTVTVIVWAEDFNGCVGNDSVDIVLHNCNIIKSVDQNELAVGNVKIYPNPAESQFTLQLSNWQTDEAWVRMLTTNGSQVFEEQILRVSNGVIRQFDISNLAKGMYFIQLQTDQGITRYPIVIK